MLGSSTITVWNLLSRAESFSICFLYSSIVVAPITWISPLASAGFMIFDASIAPSAPPAPARLWISSINIITSLFAFNSSTIFLTLSSNSPLYLAPARRFPISRVIIRLFLRVDGISPEFIF